MLLPAQVQELVQEQERVLALGASQGSFQGLSSLTDFALPLLHLAGHRSLRAAPCALPELEQEQEQGLEQAGVLALLSHHSPLPSAQTETALRLQKEQELGQRLAAQALPCALGESVHP